MLTRSGKLAQVSRGAQAAFQAIFAYARLDSFGQWSAFPGVETIGQKIGVGRRQAQRLINELEQAKLIAVHRAGGRDTNLYVILADDVLAQAQMTDEQQDTPAAPSIENTRDNSDTGAQHDTRDICDQNPPRMSEHPRPERQGSRDIAVAPSRSENQNQRNNNIINTPAADAGADAGGDDDEVVEMLLKAGVWRIEAEKAAQLPQCRNIEFVRAAITKGSSGKTPGALILKIIREQSIDEHDMKRAAAVAAVQDADAIISAATDDDIAQVLHFSEVRTVEHAMTLGVKARARVADKLTALYRQRQSMASGTR